MQKFYTEVKQVNHVEWIFSPLWLPLLRSIQSENPDEWHPEDFFQKEKEVLKIDFPRHSWFFKKNMKNNNF